MKKKIKIISDGLPQNTKVFINNKLQMDISEITFKIGVLKPSIIILKAYNGELHFEGEMKEIKPEKRKG